MAVRASKPILTVDVPLFTLQAGTLCVALQVRDKPPFVGARALIGGFVRPREDASTMATARRVLNDKAGLTGFFLEQLMTFSGPERDPRGWSASVVYYALVAEDALEPARARNLAIVPVDEARGLPFDHDAIVAKSVERLRGKGAYSSLPAFLLPPIFTLSQLRGVYEKVMDTPLNDSAFRRKIDELRFLEPVEGQYSTQSARPAQLFRLRRSVLTEFDRRF